MWPYLTIAGVLYGLYTTLAYLPQAREASWYVPVGLGLALTANICWLLLTRHLQTADRILLGAIWWDVMVVSVSLLVPTVFFKIHLNTYQWFGVGLITTGVILTHLRT